MLPLPKFIKPWKDAGEANALFAPCAFIDEHVFLAKTGALGLVFELAGIDPECLTDATMETNTKRLVAAWRLFHEDIRLYQYVVKHDSAHIEQQKQYDSAAVQATVTSRREFLEQKGLYSIQLYLAILLEPGAVGQKAASSFLNKGRYAC
jgi:type IV secretion system protein VirB4